MYTAFAQVYDELMADVDYAAWAAYYGQLLAYYGLTEGKIAECACGTGNLTLPMHRKGYSMTGIDISPEMLWQASQKARKNGIAIPFVKQDMCSLRLHRAMDAVLATCDGVNYLLSSERVLAFFKSAFISLRQGGVLLFDVSTPYKFKTQLGDNLMWTDEEAYSYVWENSYNEANKIIDMHLTIFSRSDNDKYIRIDEQQQQRAHSFEELGVWLLQAGFSQITCFGDKHMGVPAENELRWHIIARKPQEIPGQDI